MKIYACPNCGSKRIHIGTLGSGVTYGVTSWDYVCKNCNYRGMPLIFDSDEEYKKFIKGITKDIEQNLDQINKTAVYTNQAKGDEEQKLSERDKQTLESLKDLNLEEKDDEKTHWHGNRSWWIEIFSAFGISAVISVFGFTVLSYSSNSFLAFIYSLAVFFVEGLFFLVIIVIIEYFVLLKFL